MRTPNRRAKAKNVAPRTPRSSADGDEVVAGKHKRLRIKDSHKECFVPLTKDEERQVGHAFKKSNEEKNLVSPKNYNFEITGKQLRCLRPGGWLNSEVINAYLELLKAREMREPQKFLKCHFFNTFFYEVISSGRGYEDAQRWTRPEKLGYNLLGCDKIFVPIHIIDHWTLAVINNNGKKFQYLDSFKEDPNKVLDTLEQKKKVLDTVARYYIYEVNDKKGKHVDVSLWEREIIKGLPEQENTFDCGVFMIKYIDFYSRDIELCFSQEDMPYFRKWTAAEILNLKADTGFVAPLETQKKELPGARRRPPRWGADFYFP